MMKRCRQCKKREKGRVWMGLMELGFCQSCLRNMVGLYWGITPRQLKRLAESATKAAVKRSKAGGGKAVGDE